MEVYLGTILAFGFNFAPRGWMMCNGQLLSIAQNSALFALLGTTYGGNGQTTFALPDLRGRGMIGFGQFGSTTFQLGQAAGNETVTLLASNLPSHNHPLLGQNSGANASTPGGNLLANASGNDPISGNAVDVTLYAPAGTGTPMAPGAIGMTGQSQPFPIRSPYLACNLCICTEGLYPPRP